MSVVAVSVARERVFKRVPGAASGVVLLLVVGLLAPVRVSAAPVVPGGSGGSPGVASTPVGQVAVRAAPAPAPMPAWRATGVSWPAGGSGVVPVDGSGGSGGPASGRPAASAGH